jgi:excinuclease ABC subunit C
VRAESAVPKTTDEAASLMHLIDNVFSPAERRTTQIPTHEIDELLLLSSWFRRFPEELHRTSASPAAVAAAS